MIEKNSAIIVTGAAGFIGGCMVSLLNAEGFEKLILVDEFNNDAKKQNLRDKKFLIQIEREDLFNWLNIEKPEVKFIFHLGARTDTAEFNYAVHQHLNVEYSQKVWNYCSLNNIPLVYASSAATYGLGEHGYNDDHSIINLLKPLNPYGISKNEFDKWALHKVESHDKIPSHWAGLKFFNVYGPNEYHKGRMASMIFHSYHQIKKDGLVKLFKSYKEDFKDGEQLRDFIYVKDVIKICYWFMENFSSGKSLDSGIYNVGTGIARSFNDLINATYNALKIRPAIVYIDMPGDIKNTYQYYTMANMKKIHDAGYDQSFHTLEQGVDDYVKNYLSSDNMHKYY